MGAAVGTIGIVPYVITLIVSFLTQLLIRCSASRFTLVFMAPTNSALIAQTAKTTLSEVQVRGLVEKWAFLNLLRSGIPVLGTALGLYSAL